MSAERFEPPGRLDRVVTAARAAATTALCAAPSPVCRMRWWTGSSGWAGARKTPTTTTDACCWQSSRPTRPG